MNKIKGFNIIVLAALTVFTLTSISSCGSIYSGTIAIVNNSNYSLPLFITDETVSGWGWERDYTPTEIKAGETKEFSVSGNQNFYFIYFYYTFSYYNGPPLLAQVYVQNGETVRVIVWVQDGDYRVTVE
jgi:hypothetical protein